ncbi:MAG: hypothetical protein WCG25_00975 [bacterium]
MGIYASISSAKSQCGSIRHNQSPFQTSCLAKVCKNTDFHVPDFHIQ